MREIGYGEDYQYAHDFPDAFVDQEFLPEGLRGRTYYRPVDRGLEGEIKRRLEAWRARRQRAAAPQRPPPGTEGKGQGEGASPRG
jgi:putative ATPase